MCVECIQDKVIDWEFSSELPKCSMIIPREWVDDVVERFGDIYNIEKEDCMLMGLIPCTHITLERTKLEL